MTEETLVHIGNVMRTAHPQIFTRHSVFGHPIEVTVTGPWKPKRPRFVLDTPATGNNVVGVYALPRDKDAVKIVPTNGKAVQLNLL